MTPEQLDQLSENLRLIDDIRSRDAKTCADWMRKFDIAKMNIVGPFSDLTIRPGMTARIGKGSAILTVGHSEVEQATQDMVVKITRVDTGFINPVPITSPAYIRHTHIVWVDHDGRTRSTDGNNIVEINPKSEPEHSEDPKL